MVLETPLQHHPDYSNPVSYVRSQSATALGGRDLDLLTMDQIEILEAEATILRHRLQIVLSQIRRLKREKRPKSKRLSAEARKKIGEAQKKKWADYRSRKNN
jgi:hypothetical protein